MVFGQMKCYEYLSLDTGLYCKEWINSVYVSISMSGEASVNQFEQPLVLEAENTYFLLSSKRIVRCPILLFSYWLGIDFFELLLCLLSVETAKQMHLYLQPSWVLSTFLKAKTRTILHYDLVIFFFLLCHEIFFTGSDLPEPQNCWRFQGFFVLCFSRKTK